MVYIMKYYTGGKCRTPEQQKSGQRTIGQRTIGVAVAVRELAEATYQETRARLRPTGPSPTDERAALCGIMLALEAALKQYHELRHRKPRLEVTVYSDSKYAVGSMKRWRTMWWNGWLDQHGKPVANRDILWRATNAEQVLMRNGTVQYFLNTSEQNATVGGTCNMALDLVADLEDSRKITHDFLPTLI